MTRCAVLGHPIAHSLSPTLHRAAYAELGLDWSYDAVDVAEGALRAFVDGLDESWRGLSLTMPLKRAVVPLLDEADELVALSGVANTVLLRPNGDRAHRRGRNTDIPGAVAAIRERSAHPIHDATILGGGATATSMLFALAELGCRDVRLAVRNPERARATVEAAMQHPRAPRIHVESIDNPVNKGPATDIVISTIPAAAQTPEVLETAHGAMVFEVIYDPSPTPLAAAAAAAGQVLVSGFDLLVHQAALQVELMTGVAKAPIQAMRAAGEAELAARAGHR